MYRAINLIRDADPELSSGVSNKVNEFRNFNTVAGANSHLAAASTSVSSGWSFVGPAVIQCSTRAPVAPYMSSRPSVAKLNTLVVKNGANFVS